MMTISMQFQYNPLERKPAYNASALDLFSLYFPPETSERIAEETNRYTEWLQQQKGQLDINWKPTSTEEMKVFIGCNILMGIT